MPQNRLYVVDLSRCGYGVVLPRAVATAAAVALWHQLTCQQQQQQQKHLLWQQQQQNKQDWCSFHSDCIRCSAAPVSYPAAAMTFFNEFTSAYVAHCRLPSLPRFGLPLSAEGKWCPNTGIDRIGSKPEVTWFGMECRAVTAGVHITFHGHNATVLRRWLTLDRFDCRRIKPMRQLVVADGLQSNTKTSFIDVQNQHLLILQSTSIIL